MTLHPIRATCAVALLLLVGALACGPAARAADNLAWTAQPAANGFGAGRAEFGYTVTGGGRVVDRVEIANRGDSALHLALRPADAVMTASGRIGLGTAAARGVGAWVRVARGDVTVEPGDTVTVPFTVAPPRGAAAGDHVGGIVVAPAGPAAAGGRTLLVRLRVSGVVKPALAVQGIHMHYAGGTSRVEYTIKNTGNAILSARQAVEVSGPFGVASRRAGRIADSPALLPGATWRVRVPVRDVAPVGRVKAAVTLTPLLADASGSIAPLAAVGGTGHALAIPWALLVLLVVVVGLAAAVVVRVRRRRGAGVTA